MRGRILWVEDQDAVVSAFAPTLAALDASIVHARDAESAFHRFSSDGPWMLLIVDLQMPPGQWGGMDLLRRLSDYLVDVPAVVLSGAGTLNECITALRLGAKDYVQKERALDDLAPTLVRVLDATARVDDATDYQRVVATERKLHSLVLSLLKEEASRRGVVDIFRSLVPTKIALKTYERMLEAGSGTQDECLDLIDLREIIDKNWQVVPGLRGLEVITKVGTKERTKWIARFNEARKVVAHPVRGSLTAEHRADIKRAWEIVCAWELRLRHEQGAQ